MKRKTWQREAVRDALGEAKGFISAQDLHSSLRDSGSPIGLATVYRALSSLVTSGSADSLHSPEGESLYRACDLQSHHHHLICRSCGLTIEIQADEVEKWAQDTAHTYGFSAPAHIVDIFGSCPSCS